MKSVRIHMVSDDALMTELSVASKMVPTPATLAALFEAGKAAAERFLSLHGDDLGRKSSVDLPEMYG
jgi:NTE family protein